VSWRSPISAPTSVPYELDTLTRGRRSVAFRPGVAERLGIGPDDLTARNPRLARWPEMRELFAQTFRTRTRDEWAALFADVDTCVAPVMGLIEAIDHPAPRFARTPGRVQRPPRLPGEDTTGTLVDWGFDADEVAQLLAAGVVAQPQDPEHGVFGGQP
jgi:alpha-methylacyl-CoA racemase